MTLSRDEFLEMDLAVRLEDELLGEDLATIVGAFCWVLAGLVLQIERTRGIPPNRSVLLIVGQLQHAITKLRPLPADDAPVTH